MKYLYGITQGEIVRNFCLRRVWDFMLWKLWMVKLNVIPFNLTDKLQTLKLNGHLLSNINKVGQLKILVIWNVMPCQ